jgi:hypothetical protein
MENEIKILTEWLRKTETAFKEKYGSIMEKKGAKTNTEFMKQNEASTALSFIGIWKRRLDKMNAGKEMPARIIKKIHNLPDFKNTHPNMLNK